MRLLVVDEAKQGDVVAVKQWVLIVGVYMHAMIARCVLVRIFMWYHTVDGWSVA